MIDYSSLEASVVVQHSSDDSQQVYKRQEFSYISTLETRQSV
jgi:hypothetical protein